MLAVDPTVMQNLIQDSLKNAVDMEIDQDPGKDGATAAVSGGATNNKPEDKHDEPMDGVADESHQHPEHMHN